MYIKREGIYISTELNYEKRVLAFLDIMGFKGIIKKAENTEYRIELIKNLIELKKMEYSRKSLAGIQFNYEKELTVFSDSIVISYDIAKSGAIENILFDIILMQIDLISMGILLRGGITIGDVFHKGGVILGPAMIKAYEMESSLAIYPRIIVDPVIIDYTEEKESTIKLLRSCENNYYYTDFLSMDAELGYEYERFMKDVKNLIETGLKSSDIRTRNKYEWLEKYYLSVHDK